MQFWLQFSSQDNYDTHSGGLLIADCPLPQARPSHLSGIPTLHTRQALPGQCPRIPAETTQTFPDILTIALAAVEAHWAALWDTDVSKDMADPDTGGRHGQDTGFGGMVPSNSLHVFLYAQSTHRSP